MQSIPGFVLKSYIKNVTVYLTSCKISKTKHLYIAFMFFIVLLMLITCIDDLRWYTLTSSHNVLIHTHVQSSLFPNCTVRYNLVGAFLPVVQHFTVGRIPHWSCHSEKQAACMGVGHYMFMILQVISSGSCNLNFASYVQ